MKRTGRTKHRPTSYAGPEAHLHRACAARKRGCGDASATLSRPPSRQRRAYRRAERINQHIRRPRMPPRREGLVKLVGRRIDHRNQHHLPPRAPTRLAARKLNEPGQDGILGHMRQLADIAGLPQVQRRLWLGRKEENHSHPRGNRRPSPPFQCRSPAPNFLKQHLENNVEFKIFLARKRWKRRGDADGTGRSPLSAP
jgi:hypothetical protein